MDKLDVIPLIEQRMAAKTEREVVLRAFGFETDPVNNKPVPPPPVPVIISARTLHMDAITAKLRTDIPGFLKRYFNFPDDEYPEPTGSVPHVVNLLEEMFIGGKVVAEFATDHCKSMAACKFFPILSLAENPDESHILMGANESESKRRLQVVQRELEGGDELSDRLLADFPWLRKPERPKKGGSGGLTWSRKELTVSGRSVNRPDPSLYAGTIGSNDMRQRRGKLIMDDVEGTRNAKTALSREEVYTFITTEATRCLEDRTESKRPLLIALGTPFDPASIYFRLEDENWRLIKLPAYAVPRSKIEESDYMKGGNTSEPWENRAARLPDRYFTWPRKRFKVTGADPLFGKGLKKAQFGIQYLLDPAEAKPGRLSLTQLKALVHETETPGDEDWQIFCSLDPAAGTQTRFADYAGISVVKIRWPRSEKFPLVRVLEAFKFEQGLFEQVQLCADLCRDYGCKMIYESNSQQGGTYANAFGHLRPEVKLIPFYTTHGAKFDEEQGLTVVSTLVRNERLKVPADKLEDEGMQALLTEIRDLGTERHDHLTCSVWFSINHIYQQVRHMNSPALVGTMSGRGFGNNQPLSWRNWRR